jgi:probable phosphoglycerate mutase
MRTVLLIRHGEIAGDPAHRFVGQIDLPMSEEGEAQIRELARRLGDVALDAVYCSDLGRSRRTAELLAGGRVVPLHVLPGLREIGLGAWEGLPRREVAEHWPAEYEQRGRDIANFRPPGGESFADLALRVLSFWQSVTAENGPGTIAIAAHAGVNRAILCHVLCMPLSNLFRLAQPHGCLNVIEWDRHGPTVRLLGATGI